MSTTSSRRRAWYVLLASSMAAQAALAQDPADGLNGRWRPQDDPAAVVNVVCKTGSCDGELVSHTEHPERVGTQVLRALRWQADTRRWSGKVYAARLDRELDADAALDGDTRFVLEVHTWLGSRHVVWERLPAATPAK